MKYCNNKINSYTNAIYNRLKWNLITFITICYMKWQLEIQCYANPKQIFDLIWVLLKRKLHLIAYFGVSSSVLPVKHLQFNLIFSVIGGNSSTQYQIVFELYHVQKYPCQMKPVLRRFAGHHKNCFISTKFHT